VTLTLGVIAPYGAGVITSGPLVAEFVAIAEECGVESIWTVEHVIEAKAYERLYPYSPTGKMPGHLVPMADPLEVLAFVAGTGTSLRLGTGVMVAPLHSPVVLAKRAATLSCLSGGRLELGLGIGWQKEEYTSVGVPYADRGGRLRETIEAMRALWSQQPASYDGKFVSFREVYSLPAPTGGTVPIVLGGSSDPAIRRCARIGDGWFPHAMTPDGFARGVALLRSAAAQAGRPAELPITVSPASADGSREFDVDWTRAFVEQGATRLVINSGVRQPDDLRLFRERVLRYRREILEPLVRAVPR
jgi:probable F420-dependent oxidoreductase